MDEARILGSDIKLIPEDDDKKLVTFADGLCKIQIGRSFGSGFLCGFKCGSNGYVRGMFTNNHVLDRQQKYTMIRGSCTNVISDDNVEDFWTNKELDVTFVTFKRDFARLLGSNGWYYFAVADEETSHESSVKILQHPDGGRASVSRGTIIDCSNNTLHYDASTLPGSSGSPLIDTDYRVFGIHKQRGPQCDENDASQGVSYNIGVPIRRAIELMTRTTEITSTSNETNSSSNESRPPIKPKNKPRDVPSSPATQTDDKQTSILRKELEDLRRALEEERFDKETVTKSYLEYVRKVKDLDDENGELKRSNRELKEKLEKAGEQINQLRKEVEDLRHLLKQESVEKETLNRKMKDLDFENADLKQKLQDSEIQLFQYSAGARRRAEVETFGKGQGMRCILCSASGLFHMDIEQLGGGDDWREEWKQFVIGSGGVLGWWLMMPHPADNLVVRMLLWRQDDIMAMHTQYDQNFQCGNAPPQITIDCEVTFIIEFEDGTSTARTKQKLHKMVLDDDGVQNNILVLFPFPTWAVVSQQKLPTVKIQLLNIELN